MSSGSLKRWDNQVTRISAATCGTSVSLLSLQSPGLPRESHPIDMWNKKLRGRVTRLAGIRAASSDRRATKNTKKMEGGMDRLDLPKHIVERVERRWAQKLQEQALAWKSSRSEAQSTTATGVPVIRRGKRARKSQREEAA